MTDEIAIEVFRGASIESGHEMAICVANDNGEIIFEWGDIKQKTFPRSAVKLIQAMPLVMSRATDAFSLDDRMLALACASHSGEAAHAGLVAEMLAKADLSESDLQCGTHWPSNKTAAYELAGSGKKPCALHNNCSGKHAGFLLYAKQKGYSIKNYVAPDHPVQRDSRALLEEVMGEKIADSSYSVDGCSIPAYRFSLTAMAHAFAKLGTGKNLSTEQGAAANRLRTACSIHPFFTAGTDRFDTLVMQIFSQRVYVKTGAEGVYCGILPELKLGFALKCHDGTTRAAECATANLIASLLPVNESEKRLLAPLCAPMLKNWRGIEVGKIMVSTPLRKRLASNALDRANL
jgi:L-asparaginase II